MEKLAIATYNPQSNSETDFVVYDRDFSGTNVDQHGKAGDGGVNIIPSYSKITNYKFGWTTSQLTGGFPGEGTAPSAPTFDMPRTDGYQVGALILQGVRAYDPSIEQWTTPDFYKGDVDSPTSQWAYAWNAGNPLTNTDPTGNVVYYWQQVVIIQPVAGFLSATTGFILLPYGAIGGAAVGAILALPTDEIAGIGTVPGGAAIGAYVAYVGGSAGSLPFWESVVTRAVDGYNNWQASQQEATGLPTGLASEPGGGHWEPWWSQSCTIGGPGTNGTCTYSSGVEYVLADGTVVTNGDTLDTGNAVNIQASLGFGMSSTAWASTDACNEYACWLGQ